MAMSRQDRAKQFAPFDALRGLREALRQKELEHERCERRELSEEYQAELAQTVAEAAIGDELEVTFYYEGRYVQMRGRLKGVDGLHRALLVEEGRIPFRDLFALKILS